MPFSGFCPSFGGRFKIWAVVAFFVAGVYFIGFRSFRRSVGLLLRCLWPVVVSRVRFGSPGAVSVVPGFICGPLAPSGSRSAFRSDALRGSCVDPLRLPCLASYMARYWLLFCFACSSSPVALSSFCGPLDALRRFRFCFPVVGSDALPLLGLVSLYEFGRVLGVVIVSTFARLPFLVLGIICLSFFRVPFGILCGFFSCHGSIIPGAGRRSRFPFSASGGLLRIAKTALFYVSGFICYIIIKSGRLFGFFCCFSDAFKLSRLQAVTVAGVGV